VTDDGRNFDISHGVARADGADWVVAWCRARQPMGDGTALSTRTVAADGTLGAIVDIQRPSPCLWGRQLSIVADGDDLWLAVAFWEAGLTNDMHVYRLTADGALADGPLTIEDAEDPVLVVGDPDGDLVLVSRSSLGVVVRQLGREPLEELASGLADVPGFAYSIAAPGANGTVLLWGTENPQDSTEWLSIGAVDQDGNLARELVLEADFAWNGLGVASRRLLDGTFETAVAYGYLDPLGEDPQFLYLVRVQGL
jgi:hypothetical protein